MKRTACCVAAVSALMMIAGTPASAQPGWGQPSGWSRDQIWRDAPDDIYQRIIFLQRRVDRAAREGALSPREAHWADYKLDEMRRGADNDRARHHGYLNPHVAHYIQAQLDRLSGQLHWRQRMTTGYDTPRDRWGDNRWDRWNR